MENSIEIWSINKININDNIENDIVADDLVIKKSKKIKKLFKKLECKIHEKEINFICLEKNCLKKWCVFCLLEHKIHLTKIKCIKTVFNQYYDNFNNKLINFNLNEENNQIIIQKELDEIQDQINNLVEEKFKELNYKVIKKIDLLENNQLLINKILIDSKKLFTFKKNFNLKNIKLIKLFLKNDFCNSISKFRIDRKMIKNKFKDIIENNIVISKNDLNLQSLDKNNNIYIHWFEWNKRKLNLFNIITNKYTQINLIISFKIPNYSRSIMIPDGRIFLIGGAIYENLIKKEVYYFETNKNKLDNELKFSSSMLVEKFDFSVCYLNDYIYIISGKDINNNITNLCERFNVKTNVWENIDKLKYKRFAASAIPSKNFNKIFVFGGRNDLKDYILDNVEEYNVERNQWKEIKIKNFELWIPVEISQGIQIEDDKILLFGGSNSLIKDTNYSYIYDIKNNNIKKIESLKIKQVFLSSPIIFGKNVYALGNEYYVNNRNIHKFDIENYSWDIIY